MKILHKFRHLLFILSLAGIFSLAVLPPSFAADNTDEHKADSSNDELLSSCDQASMKAMYSGNSDEELKKKCWSCNVVIIMTNAYLQAAEASIPTTVELGHVILKWGFLIWLAIFLLKQLSSMSGVTPGKMLQEILMMSFKCAFCYYALDMGTDFVTTYILNPIVITGTDIGDALLTNMLERMSATSPAQSI